MLLVSNSSISNTGFGKSAKTVLKYLWETNKYEIAQMCIGGIYKFEDDPSFSKTPWKNYGSLPKNVSKIENLLHSPDHRRVVAYGYYGIDEVVKDFKPDFLIFAEDPWAGSNLHQKPWWDQVNCLFWTTLDSLPILPKAIEQANHMKNYAVWADFAQTALNHVSQNKKIDLLYAAIPLDKFYPMNHTESLSYRRKFGIEDDEFVVFMNSRNQLRKYFYNNIEAVSLLNKKFHNKIKFLVNTDINERGWDLMSQVNEYGLDHKNFLCSYVCESCSDFFVSNYQGPKLNCEICKTKNSVSFPSVKKGVSDDDLNVLYNISDYYSLPISSGGFEITILEALSCGLRIGTVDYSSGENFLDAPQSDFYDYVFYREVHSNFLKANVLSNSIVEKLTNQINEKGLKHLPKNLDNCKYARDKFDPSITCKKIEDWIDSNSKTDFDFSIIENIQPDISIQFDEKEGLNNDQYVEYLYTTILKRPSDPKGKRDWLENLDHGISRKHLFDSFIKIGFDILNSQPKNVTDFVEENNKYKIAIACSRADYLYCDIIIILNSLTEKHKIEETDYYLIIDPNSNKYFDSFSYLKFIPYFDLSKEKEFIESDHIKETFDKFISLDNIDKLSNYAN